MAGVDQASDQDGLEAEAFSNAAPDIAELFDLAAASFGFAANGVLPKLAAGEPLAVAAGMPSALLELLYGRAHLWVKVGHVERAERIFQALCMADPQEPDYWAGLGLCLTRRGAWERALQAYDRALARRPDWGVLHVYCLEACVHLKAWDRAALHSRRVREFSGEIPDDLLALAARHRSLCADRIDDVSGGSGGA